MNIKKFLPLIAIALTLVTFSLVSPTSTQAAASGPAGVNGLRAYSGPGKGQVTLEWSRVTLTGENYSLRYGTTSGSYPFVADHVGYIATYTVSNLIPGQKYYFVLERIQTGNVSLGWNGEVSVVASSSPTTVVVTSGPIGRNLLVASSGGSGKVKLSWKRYFSDTESWHIVYGTKPGQYQYGVLNADQTTSNVSDYSFTIGALKHGQRYYFALAPVRGGVAQYITAEVSFIAQ